MIALLLAAALVPQVQSYHSRPSLRSVERPLPVEGYRIRIDADGQADVSAADAAGRFYAAICKFAKDETLPFGRYAMEIHYDRGITVRHADERGRERALEALKALARPDGKKLEKLSFSCLEIED